MSNEERDDDNMEQRITGSTVLLGLFGSPVKHSVSPMMHNLSFEALGLDYAYLAFKAICVPVGKRVLRSLGKKWFY